MTAGGPIATELRQLGTKMTVSFFRFAGERVFAAGLLIALSPLIALLALLVKLDSKGPVFLRQERIGLHEKPFFMFKIRSMHSGAGELHQKLLTRHFAETGSFLLHMPNDQRVTRVGRIIRKTSLDELPQLLNVLGGTMSLVGPRPMLPSEATKLSDEQKRRFSVLPGVTGLAQVSGRSSLGSERYVALDLEYIDGYSALLYWRILFRTPVAVVTTRGAV